MPSRIDLCKQGKRLFAMTDDPIGQVGTKRASQSEIVNGLQQTGFATAISPQQDIEPLTGAQLCQLDIAKIADL